MKSKQLKFLIGSVAILAALGYFGYQGFNESMSYFQTVPEMYASGDKAFERKSLKVQGEVIKGSIRREGQATVFAIGPQDFKAPQNFKPGPETFEGTFIQAQCASKYEREMAAEEKKTAANE
jgi:cytochrome c-type biogenesis protein CcmE